MLARLKALLEDRTGWVSSARGFLDTPVPGGARVALAFGWMIVALLVAEFATGIALGFVYAPSAQTAWASVFHIEHAFRWGRTVRGMHYWCAQALVIVTVAHMLQTLLFAAYRKPREVNWWLGLVLLLLVIGAAHTGQLLPWDEGAYWITSVELGIAGSVPPVGDATVRLAQGGRELGSLIVARLYVLHVGLLPLLLVVVVSHHARLYRRHQLRELEAGEGSAVPATTPRAKLWPDQLAPAAFASAAVLFLSLYLARKHGAPLDAPADPLSDYPARPEWYLLWLFELRKLLGKAELVATVVIPALFAGLLVALPFLDRGPSRSIARRGAAVLALIIMGPGIGALTLYPMRKDARDQRGFQQPLARARARAVRARELAARGIPPEGPLEMLRNDPRTRPRELYDANCANCHAEAGAPLRDARGQRTNARAPTLDGFGTREWIRALLVNPDADDLFGRTDIHDMPPQARRLRDEGMSAMTEYLYAQGVEPGDPPADAALVARGAELYFARCTVCHQGEGDTSETPAEDRDAPDLTRWASRDWIRDQILNPEHARNYGTRNHMPNFREELRGRELEWVVDYVRGLRTRRAPTSQPPPPPPPRPAEENPQ